MLESQRYFVSIPKSKIKNKISVLPTVLLLPVGLSLFFTLIQLNLVEVLRLDRSEHFLASLLICLLFLMVGVRAGSSLLLAVGGAIVIGFLKELSDPSFEIFDIYANLMGVFVAVLICFASVTLARDDKSDYSC